MSRSRSRSRSSVASKASDGSNAGPQTKAQTELMSFDTAGVFSLVHDLRADNVDCDIDLPRLACVGKQSSGKSSVIEALTGFQVPRKDDTCTRGAIEIVTKQDLNVEWLADISLRMIFDDADNIKRVSPVTIPLTKLTNPHELGSALEEAQAMILNPRAFLDHKWPGGRDQAKAELKSRPVESWELKFTRNVIQVSLTGKTFQNLIVTDLPGLIQSTETKEDERYIDLIIELCESYCKSKNTVIIACFCCNDDMENQAVHKLARDMDQRGDRTVGVLTKPDLIQEGNEELWFRVFQNKKYPLAKGYYVIRCRTQLEMEKEASAEDVEETFFDEHDIGKKFSLFCSDRCTTNHLRKALASMLKNKIDEQLPQLHDQLVEKYEENIQALEQMGPALSGELEVRRLIVNCCSSLAKKMEDCVLVSRYTEAPVVGEESIWHKIEDLFMYTYHRILGTKPLFCNGEEVLPSIEEEGAALEVGREATVAAAGKSPITAGCHVQIEEIRKRIEECRGRNLKVAGSPPAYQVSIEMLRKTTQSWERFSLEVLETVLELVTTAIRQHAEEVLREYPALHQKMVDFLLTLLAEIAVRTHQQVAFFMEMESQHPFTVNAHYLDSQVTKATINLRKKMGKFSVNNLDEYQQRQLASLIAEGGGDMTLMWVADRTGRGENELVSAMAIAQSYFKVAHKRFADNLLMTVDHMMLRGFANRVEQHLLDRLQVFEAPAEVLLGLVREDPVKSRRRELVENAISRQREGINRLDHFLSSSNLKSKVKTREQRNADHCVGLPDVSGIFSSGRSLGQLLEGSRLGKILGGSQSAAQAAALDRREQERIMREKKKDEKKKKEAKEERDERKKREEREKKERKEKRHREEAEKRRMKYEEEKKIERREFEIKRNEERAAERDAARNGEAPKEGEPTTTTTEPKKDAAAADSVTQEFQRLKEKLMEVKAAERKAAADKEATEKGSESTTMAEKLVGGIQPKALPKAAAMRPREEGETEEEAAKRLRRERFGE